MARLLLCVSLVLLVVCENEAKTYDRCTLAREIHRRGVPRDEVNHYVCLVEHNSFDTSWTGGPYEDGSINYGIFQLNSKDVCVVDRRGGRCDTHCNRLTDGDIRDDIECARKVHDTYGFEPWWVWRKHCKSGVADLSYCY